MAAEVIGRDRGSRRRRDDGVTGEDRAFPGVRDILHGMAMVGKSGVWSYDLTSLTMNVDNNADIHVAHLSHDHAVYRPCRKDKDQIP